MGTRTRIVITVLMVASLVPITSGAATPPVLVATAAGFATPVLRVQPGEIINFRSVDLVHNFSTTAGICDSGSDTVPASCNEDAAGLSPTATRIEIHENAPPGEFSFNCKYHAFWMRGVVMVEASST